jgi:hypothetical protein
MVSRSLSPNPDEYAAVRRFYCRLCLQCSLALVTTVAMLVKRDYDRLARRAFAADALFEQGHACHEPPEF